MVSRIVLGLVVVALALAPVVGFASSDLSASPAGKHHTGRLHHQPERAWRTVPSTPASAAHVPAAVTGVERVRAVETAVTLPVVLRVPFIPPRG
jgi:hypothetical protein